MAALDMKHVYKNYKGQWVALERAGSNKVVVSAKTLDQVLEKAKKKGFDLPWVMKIPKKVLPIVGSFPYSK